MKLEKIRYSDLNSRQKEIFNFQKVAGLLADYGFNCIKLADDWEGADFLAYHKNGHETLKIQLKSRLAIAQKYINRYIWCFQLVVFGILLDMTSWSKYLRSIQHGLNLIPGKSMEPTVQINQIKS
ncbi:hypothetical protein [Nitrosomonas sp.]|uniref:hypothetical protein n=1 Tax=Nitrosomonas sp. TaxID=42353 RepID=UPI001E03C4A0|nr:hypothetical protein [Nitrosomonas sp.]MBX3617740.1 hypothetical protein [Nitrosomonas sp.]